MNNQVEKYLLRKIDHLEDLLGAQRSYIDELERFFDQMQVSAARKESEEIEKGLHPKLEKEEEVKPREFFKVRPKSPAKKPKPIIKPGENTLASPATIYALLKAFAKEFDMSAPQVSDCIGASFYFGEEILQEVADKATMLFEDLRSGNIKKEDFFF